MGGELSLLSMGLNFCPQRHFNLFNTIVDTNRFIRNVTIKRHYCTLDDKTTRQSVYMAANVVSNSKNLPLKQLHAVRDLEDLAAECGIE